MQGNVCQGARTVEVEIKPRLIEPIFFKIFTFSRSQILIALLFWRKIWQEWCLCLTILAKRRHLCFWFQTCLSQNLIRDRKFPNSQIGHYITVLMYCLNIQKEIKLKLLSTLQIHLLGFSTIFLNYSLQFRAPKSI